MEYQLGTTSVFGKPYSKINFRAEKPQAKRIVGIADLLKDHPDLAGLFESKLSDFLGNYF